MSENRMKPRLSSSKQPKTKEGVLWIECLKGNAVQEFLVYANEPQGLDLHWLPNERKTVPCYEDHSLCPGGHNEDTLKWRCYVHCYSYTRHIPIFLQLTWEAWQSWLHQMQEGVSCRGQVIEVHRTNANNGRLWVVIKDWNPRSREKIPEAMDARDSVVQMCKFQPSGAQVKGKWSPGRHYRENLPNTNGVGIATPG